MNLLTHFLKIQMVQKIYKTKNISFPFLGLFSKVMHRYVCPPLISTEALPHSFQWLHYILLAGSALGFTF